MPKISKKKKIVEEILLKGCFELVSATDMQCFDSAFEQCAEEFRIAMKYRYSVARAISVPKSDDWFNNVLPEYEDDRFKSCLRVSRDTFHKILGIIAETKVFKNLDSKKSHSLELQLAVALFRFGHDGTGASYHRVAEHFGVSDAGMITLCTNRVIQALLTLKNVYITWPTEQERIEICTDMEEIMPGCVGYMDGSHIPLFEAPMDEHEAYFSRKQQYAMHLHAICDNRLLFRSISVGYPASAHDARVFSNTPMGLHPERFLSPGQWLAGDSAYRATQFVVTPFRDNATIGNRSDRRRFNRHFSSQRVKIEQAFGILKMMFGSLRSLRVRVDKTKGHKRACDWIVACIVLYNIMKPNTDEFPSELHDMPNENMEQDNNIHRNEEVSQREVVFNWFITNM